MTDPGSSAIEALEAVQSAREDWTQLYRQMWEGLIGTEQKEARLKFDAIDDALDTALPALRAAVGRYECMDETLTRDFDEMAALRARVEELEAEQKP